ncbi:MAG: EF-P lysine aminoacylase GenX, partial [Gammaproteobacteria bacterium RIFCSPHIGHO2_12_FULL_42_10]
MSHEQKNNLWRPSASLHTLRMRADVLKTIRNFFESRGVLEVETPLLSHTSVTDPFIDSMRVDLMTACYLQTSPEYAMKRLLADGSGDIFQIAKAFRQDEVGRWHNPEFTMLEWYRVGFDHHDLMNEVDALLQLILKTAPALRVTYAEVFRKYCDIDVHYATLDALIQCANAHHILVDPMGLNRDAWLELLMSSVIEPQFAAVRPVFLYDFPASQAALARIKPGNPATASRFEVYFKGMELANGFHELQNVAEQRQRFENNLKVRRERALPELPIDEYFLAALAYGLPDCAGIALGIDRLLMIKAEKEQIAEIMSFDFTRA